MASSPSIQSPLPSKLFESLFQAARGEARHALELYTESEPVVRLRAAMSAGSAVEALLMAILARTLPALLAERGDVHTQLVLSGLPGVRGKSYLDCRTVGALEASRAVALIRAGAFPLEEDVKRVLNIRNAAAHLSILTKPDLESGIRSLVAVVEGLLPAVDETSLAFWGPSLHAHAQALQQEIVDQRQIRVEEAKSTARVRLRRLKLAGEVAFEAMVEVLDAEGHSTEDEGDRARVVHKCPVCEYWGWLSGYVERGNLQHSPGDDYMMEEFWVDRALYFEEFTCDICGLHLTGGELELAGFPTSIELEPDTDPPELMEEIEDYWAQQELDRIRGK